jgi:phosphatidylglycerophosphatase A
MPLSLGERAIVAIATGGYVGYLPRAPGTAGSVLGLVLAWLLSTVEIYLQIVLIAGLFALGVVISSWAERWFGVKDHSAIVIDEIVGMVVALFLLPFQGFYVLAAFVVFRVLDILKPMAALERLPGGWGIMCDDVAAAFLANVLLQGIRFFLT